MPQVSVCIVNWRTRRYLDQCLTSLEAQRKSLALEAIVVDNASGDGSVELVRENYDWVTLIANRENLGHAEGNNQCLEAAQGEHLLLLNPDIVVTPGAIEHLVRFQETRPRSGAVACKLVNPDGTVQHTCRSFPTPDVVIYEALGLSRLFPGSPRWGKYRMTWWNYADEREVDQPMASCLMLRRQTLDEVGRFDPQFPIFFGDVDLCLRIKQAGWEIWFTPEAQMMHYGGASTRQVRRAMIVESHESFVRFYEKHYRGKVPGWKYSLALGLLALGKSARLLGADIGRWLGGRVDAGGTAAL